MGILSITLKINEIHLRLLRSLTDKARARIQWTGFAGVPLGIPKLDRWRAMDSDIPGCT
jgi:hypothetical protein